MWRPIYNVAVYGTFILAVVFNLGHGPKMLKPESRGTAPWVKMGRSYKFKLIQEAVDSHKPPDTWNRVFMFPDPYYVEPQSGISGPLDLVKSADFSIQIVMNLVSYQSLEPVLAKKVQEGCIIQIVTDYNTLTAQQNITIWNLKNKHGVKVRAQKIENSLMRYKFIIIDLEAVMTGYLNWNMNGNTENRENVLVTTNQRYVQPYMRAFRTLWEEGRDIDLDVLIPPKMKVKDSVR